jgi:hypothetical protein
LGALIWLKFSLLREEYIEQLDELRYVSLGGLGKGCHGVSFLRSNVRLNRLAEGKSG